MTDMKHRSLGKNGPMVSPLGVGCMHLQMQDAQSEKDAIYTVQAALDAGLNFLDTGDFYGCGQSEMIIGQALKGRRDQAFLSVKFGAMRDPNGGIIGLDARPKAVKNFVSYSLQRLRVDEIDLYQPGRADPDVPYEETIGAIADLIQEGKVRYLGVSEVGADLLRRAHAIHPVTALEIEYSLACRFIEPEILPVARELGVGIAAYRVLAEGMLSGQLPLDAPKPGSHFLAPRMQGENYAQNMATAEMLKGMAAAKGCTPAQIAVAWLLTRGEDIFPVLGISRASRIADNLAALDVVLDGADLATLDAAFADGVIKGDRYPAFVMAWAAK